MKKQLNITLILAVMVVIVPFLLNSLGMLVLFAIGIIIVSIIGLIFNILMLVRLSRAKNASPHPYLVKTFQFFIINIIIAVVGIFTNNMIFILVLDLASPIVVLIAWKSLADYVEIYRKEAPPSSGFQLVAQGIKMYTISVSLSLGIIVVSFFISFTLILGLVILTVLISFAITVYSIVASYKIANGIMAVFGGHITSASPHPSQSMYGAPTPQFTSHLPDNSSQYETPDSEPATTIQTTNAKQNICPQCGGIVDLEAKFCGVCGYTISK